MATTVRQSLSIKATRDILKFGPWDFSSDQIYTELFGAEVQIATVTLTQIIGGSSPIITAITDIQYLVIYPDQIIRVGLHGVNGQTGGFTLNANQPFCTGRGSIDSLNVYNTSTSTLNLTLAIGGT